jgi:hypothetical protein
MALPQRFRDTMLDSAVRIGDLAVDKPNLVLRTESVDTKYGLFILPIRESEDYCVSVSTATKQSVLFGRGHFGSDRIDSTLQTDTQ